MKSLLIVDDAPFIQDVLMYIFKDTEYQVVATADDGEKAVQLYKEHQPDLVIMDLVLPNKSGIDAGKEILNDFPQACIVACSTLSDSNMTKKVFDSGFRGFIAKPFKKEEVFNEIKQALSGPVREVAK
jgi:two-component system chemotaxis response regulator CheY